MNTVCRSFKHPHEPIEMTRLPNVVINSKVVAQWKCPHPDCGQIRQQGTRGRVKTKETTT